MATQQSHMTFSIVLALLYSVGGMIFFNAPAEHALLAAVIIFVAGMLPNIDHGGGGTAKEMGSLLAAVAPLVLLELFPVISNGGVVRMTLVVICAYVLTRLVIVRGFQKLTTSRGMVHSIPAAIITSQLTYLLFWDSELGVRIFLALAAFSGFMTHLFLDAYSNLDLVGKAMGQKSGRSAALSLLGDSFGTNLVAYGTMCVLGWLIAKDFYPGLGLYGGVTY